MQFSLSWLKKWIDFNESTEELSKKLYSLGLEVEKISDETLNFFNVKVARVTHLRAHPNATRLKIADVLLEEGGETIQVVCGAKNCRKGLTVAYAIPGAKVGNRVLETAELRGEISHGMLCAAYELGFDFGPDLLWELPHHLALGTELRDLLIAQDSQLEVSVTPNRADCLCVKGIARELAGKMSLQLKSPSKKPTPSSEKSIPFPFVVGIDAQNCVLSYALQYLHHLDFSKKTDPKLQQRLLSAGLKPINCVVDLLNFLMLDQGQPLHAFDADKISGPIRLRRAIVGEECILLSGAQLTFSQYCPLVVADDLGILCIAGVIGCARAAVSTETKNLLLESAVFDQKIIAQVRQHYGLITEASTRYERGVDAAASLEILEEAAAALWSDCAEEESKCSKIFEAKKRVDSAEYSIFLKQSDLQHLLGGREWTVQETLQSLEAIGCHLKPKSPDSWDVAVPSWRKDLRVAQDLMEAVARNIGYEAIIPALPTGFLHQIEAPQLLAEATAFSQKKSLTSVLTHRGFFEICTFAFTSPELHSLFFKNLPVLTVPRPISASLSLLKRYLIPGLLEVAQFNLNRQQPCIRLFELARCFEPSSEPGGLPPIEPLHFALLLSSTKDDPIHWQKKSSELGFFELKGEVVAALKAWGYSECDLRFKQLEEEEMPFLHPGQRAQIYYKNKPIGFLGQLSPDYRERLKISRAIFMAEVELSSFSIPQGPVTFSAISRFPMTRRDLSLTIPLECPIEDLLQQAQEILETQAGDIESNVQLCDLYFPKEGAMDEEKYISLALTFQGRYKNLTEQDISQAVDAVTLKLGSLFKAKLRHEL